MTTAEKRLAEHDYDETSAEDGSDKHEEKDEIYETQAGCGDDETSDR